MSGRPAWRGRPEGTAPLTDEEAARLVERARTHASRATIWSWVPTFAKKAGLDHVTPHRLSSTYVTAAVDELPKGQAR